VKPLPTDLQILNAIYDRYYNEFAYNVASRPQTAVVETDIKAVADDLGVDPDIVFGRLYYHLDPKYRRPMNIDKPEEGTVRLFFARPDFGFDGVHFPYMASVLAEMRAEDRKQ
jgi:hypothetical protein